MSACCGQMRPQNATLIEFLLLCAAGASTAQQKGRPKFSPRRAKMVAAKVVLAQQMAADVQSGEGRGRKGKARRNALLAAALEPVEEEPDPNATEVRICRALLAYVT